MWGRTLAPGQVCHHRHAVDLRHSPPWVAKRARLAGRCEAGKTDLAVLERACTAWKKAPPSEKFGYTQGILDALTSLQESGKLAKWGTAAPDLARRNTLMGELRMVGIKNPEVIGKGTERNTAAFFLTTLFSTSAVAVGAQFLPGDWGFFVPYLVGGINIAVLAIGSSAPGLLQFAIDKFSLIWPDYRERVQRHEAAHLLTGYLLGYPIANYSLMLGKEHTDFAEGKSQRRLLGRKFSDQEVNEFSVLAMAGAASEAMKYDEVAGQGADLMDLQRILRCSENKLSDREEQNMTRWAVYQAASMLRKYSKEYQAVQEAMARGASIPDCVAAIEGC